MKQLPRLPRLSYRPVRLRHVQPARRLTGRWRGMVEIVSFDLEEQAWPKGVPYNDPRSGPQIGTLPERRVLWWLLYRKQLNPVEFIFQSDVFGMPSTPGAIKSDFVIFRGPAAIVWEIQGEQWHYRFYQRRHSASRALVTIGNMVYGHRVEGYVELWEHDINMSNQRRDWVCEMAYSGFGVGR